MQENAIFWGREQIVFPTIPTRKLQLLFITYYRNKNIEPHISAGVCRGPIISEYVLCVNMWPPKIKIKNKKNEIKDQRRSWTRETHRQFSACVKTQNVQKMRSIEESIDFCCC
jgi:hypothetical protein